MIKSMKFFILSLFIFLVSCKIQNDNTEVYRVNREVTDSLVIYTPQFSSIDLVCGVEPTKEDSTIVFCCAAAFTHDYVEFAHSNIEGNHVSNGIFYEGNFCRVNTGHFVYSEQGWSFAYGLNDLLLLCAAENGGMGFSQAILIYDGDIKTKKLFSIKTNFRSLCELNGELCVVETKFPMNFDLYVEALKLLGVTNSIYLDMGTWAYAWYRDVDKINEIFVDAHSKYMTNWIVFRK